MQIIYAWSTEDPPSATKIQYHGAKNRGTKSLNLKSPNVTNFQLTDDMIPWDLQMPQVKTFHINNRLVTIYNGNLI